VKIKTNPWLLTRFLPKMAGVLLLALAWNLGPAASPAGAQLKPGGSGDSRGPIAISSDRLETDDAKGVVDFIGAVVARQGTMTITCDLLKVFYNTGSAPVKAEESSPLSGSNREIDRVEGFGHVKMVDGDHLAVSDHALYLAKNEPRRIILTGDARVWQGHDSVTGHQVTYFLDTKRSRVESDRRQRVRAVFHNEGQNK
jgi:lipopolysaccharide export system protein LptA